MRNLTPAKVSLLMFMVVGGLIVAYVAKSLLAIEEQTTVEETRTIPMTLATLEAGTIIEEAHIGVGTMKVSELKPEMLLNARGVVGRVVKERIPAAQPILASQLYKPGEYPPLNVGAGMRAVSVSLSNRVDMVDGLIKPGEYVDVHMTPAAVRNDDRYQGGLTLTLFKGIRVLAMNRSIQASNMDRTGNSVTLELTPKQANVLILARERGDITLSFNPEGRGNGRLDVTSQDRVTLEEILGLQPAQTVQPFVTEQYRGTTHSQLEFRNGKRLGQSAARSNPASRRNSSPTPAPPGADPSF